MNTNKSIVLSLLVMVAVAFLLGIAVGYAMNKTDASAAAVEHIAVYRVAPMMNDVQVRVVPIIVVRNVCSVVRVPVHVHMNTNRTNVHDSVTEEDNSSDDDVVVIVTPEPTSSYTQPAPTQTPVPTSTPMPKDKCNNGVGNGPDCPPPGHDKNDDGVSDDSKGNNDDDGSVLPCGDPGNPCNKKSNQGFMLPGFVIAWLIRLLNKNGYSVNKTIDTTDYGIVHPILKQFNDQGLLLDYYPEPDELCSSCASMGLTHCKH